MYTDVNFDMNKSVYNCPAHLVQSVQCETLEGTFFNYEKKRYSGVVLIVFPFILAWGLQF